MTTACYRQVVGIAASAPPVRDVERRLLMGAKTVSNYLNTGTFLKRTGKMIVHRLAGNGDAGPRREVLRRELVDRALRRAMLFFPG